MGRKTRRTKEKETGRRVTMTDQLVSQIKIAETGIMDARPATKLVPIYLVMFEDKKKSNFIATRFDEHPAYIKAVGFFSNKTEVEIKNEFRELVKNAQKTDLTEIYVPWQRIQQITSLVFQPR
jgi:hypothetical protein